MRKNRIRLTESQLHRVIKESVRRVLREGFAYNWESPEFYYSPEKPSYDLDPDMRRTLFKYDKHCQIQPNTKRNRYLDSYHDYLDRNNELSRPIQTEFDWSVVDCERENNDRYHKRQEAEDQGRKNWHKFHDKFARDAWVHHGLDPEFLTTFEPETSTTGVWNDDTHEYEPWTPGPDAEKFIN